jgi:hypothetical protein
MMGIESEDASTVATVAQVAGAPRSRLGKSRVALRAAQGREGAAIELLARDGDVEIVVRR